MYVYFTVLLRARGFKEGFYPKLSADVNFIFGHDKGTHVMEVALETKLGEQRLFCVRLVALKMR